MAWLFWILWPLVQQAFRHYFSLTPENPPSAILTFGFVVVGLIPPAQVRA
jgi:hypothetical protein